MDRDVELLARIIEHTPIGIIILNPDRGIRYANTVAVRLFNCDREALLGDSIDHFILDRQGETPWRELWPVIMEGRTAEAKISISRKNSEEITCTMTGFPLGGKGDQHDSVALVFRDITHEQKIAEQLEKKNIEMAKMNAELIRSNVELKRLSEMKSNFLSIASHELKTPLTSIKGYSDIIIDGMRDRIDEGVFRMIESINRAADRLHKVINNILDVTRIEQKKLRLKPEVFDIKTVVRDCIEELSQFADKRGITFHCLFAAELPQFYGDRMRIYQVFSNLFTNAIKYSPDNSSVDVSIAVENNERFHIVVKDHGIGIDKHEYKHIFDPFYEVGDISKHSTDHIKFLGSGTGLGLSIAKGIVERHGGRIWVESEGVRVNEFPGSMFHVVIPIRSEIGWDDFEKEQTLHVKNDPGNEAAVIGIHGEEKPTILLIDSDREVVEISRMVLENAFEIISAPSGELGLSLAFQYKPTLILLDASLPGLDGFRICTLLRSQEETRDTPVLFLSVLTTRNEIEKCFAAGADDFIIKPFSGKELMEKIWRMLMKKKEEAIG